MDVVKQRQMNHEQYMHDNGVFQYPIFLHEHVNDLDDLKSLADAMYDHLDNIEVKNKEQYELRLSAVNNLELIPVKGAFLDNLADLLIDLDSLYDLSDKHKKQIKKTVKKLTDLY